MIREHPVRALHQIKETSFLLAAVTWCTLLAPTFAQNSFILCIETPKPRGKMKAYSVAKEKPKTCGGAAYLYPPKAAKTLSDG